MKYATMCLSLLLILGPVPASTTDLQYLHGLGDTRYHYVQSEDIGRGYHIYVMLPEGYDSTADRRYPSVYLLDGGALFPLLTAYYRYLNFGEEIPNLIIVGISYGSDDFEGGNFRSTDFTAPSSEREHWGGAEAFQRFLGGVLLPFIERSYRSRQDRRIIFGQSLGGQFVLYTAQTKPDLFWGHIASNPALHRNLQFFLQDPAEPAAGETQPRLFVASGTRDDPRFRKPALAWMDHWSGRPAPWLLKTEDLAGQSHMSAAPASFRSGMRWLFATD